MDGIVSIMRDASLCCYPDRPPFSPRDSFPEYPFDDSDLDKGSRVYHLVRASLRELGLDAERYDSRYWNPLADIVNPGDTVVIKPNWVVFNKDTFLSTITHGSVIRPLIDYAFLALEGEGRIIIAETPAQNMSLEHFEQAVQCTGTLATVEYLKDREVPVEIRNLSSERRFISRASLRFHIEKLPGDPAGYELVDLAGGSEFASQRDCNFAYGCSYLLGGEKEHISGSRRNEYSISRTILEADVVINVPKLKTHNAAGMSGALKNAFGITDKRYWIPHWRLDDLPPEIHGVGLLLLRLRNLQQMGSGNLWLCRLSFLFRELEHIYRRLVRKIFGGHIKPIFDGRNWDGNDTLWRAILDLNKILLYADKQGRICELPQRRYLALVDGILCGEGENPLSSSPKPAGIVCCSKDPLALDLAICKIVGLDYRVVKSVSQALSLQKHSIGCTSEQHIRFVGYDVDSFDESFQLPFYWQEHSRLGRRG